MSNALSPQQQAALKKAYVKLITDLHSTETTFTERALPVLKQLDEREQAELRKNIQMAVIPPDDEQTS